MGWIFNRVKGESDIHFSARGIKLPVGAEYATPCPLCGQKSFLGGTGIPAKYDGLGYSEDFWKVYKDDCNNYAKIFHSFIADYDDWPFGLYIWSNQTGTGKTRLSCSIITSIRLRYNISVRFTSVNDYLYNLKNSYKEQGQTTSILVSDMIKADLLCLDDLGAEKRSDWTDQELFNLIDQRYQRGRKTIITSNFDIGEMPEDKRLADRIFEVCRPVHMPEEPIRSLKATIQHERFAEKMGLS